MGTVIVACMLYYLVPEPFRFIGFLYLLTRLYM